MDWDPIIDGLRVSGIGMGMVALVLVILAVVVRTTSWVDSFTQRRAAESNEQAAEVDQTGGNSPAVDDGAMRAAVIGVALALADSNRSGTPNATDAQGALGFSTAGAWLNEGRARQRINRGSSRNVGSWR